MTGAWAWFVPFPFAVNVNFGLSTSFVGKTIVAEFTPTVCGVKPTVQVPCPPAGMVAAGGVVSVKLPAFVPVAIVIAMAETLIVRAVLPVLLIVRTIVEVDRTPVSGKLRTPDPFVRPPPEELVTNRCGLVASVTVLFTLDTSGFVQAETPIADTAAAKDNANARAAAIVERDLVILVPPII
jgi:hypothetical protein